MKIATRKIVIDGETIKLYSADNGRTWPSNKRHCALWEARKQQTIESSRLGTKKQRRKIGIKFGVRAHA